MLKVTDDNLVPDTVPDLFCARPPPPFRDALHESRCPHEAVLEVTSVQSESV